MVKKYLLQLTALNIRQSLNKTNNMSKIIFNEQTLRNEIKRMWGGSGAHMEVFDRMYHDMLSKEEFAKEADKRARIETFEYILQQLKIGNEPFVVGKIKERLSELTKK